MVRRQHFLKVWALALATCAVSTPAWAQQPAGEPAAAEQAAGAASPPEDAALDDTDAGIAPLTLSVGDLSITFDGSVRTGANFVLDDDDTPDFIGENDGWVMFDARVGFLVNYADHVLAYVQLDGASSTFESPDDTVGTQLVTLKDAWGQSISSPYAQLAVGQRRPPLDVESAQSISEVLFVRRSIVSEGLRVGEAVLGENTDGLGVDRQVGVHLLSEVIALGPVGLRYHAALTNGNDARHAFNDNDDFAIYGRLELHLLNRMLGLVGADPDQSWLAVGGLAAWNPRTEGERPVRLEVEELTWGADLQVHLLGLEVLGQFLMRERDFPDLAQDAQKTLGVVAQAGYWTPWPNLEFLLAYRFALLDPFFDPPADNALTTDDQLMVHTVGAGYRVTGMPIELKLNYTLALEEESRELGNDLVELLFQFAW